MPFYRVDGVMVHLNLGGKARKNPPKPCCAPVTVDGAAARCMAISSILCDGIAGGYNTAKTCDAPLCAEHAVEVGPDEHLCPRCAAVRQPAPPEPQPELF